MRQLYLSIVSFTVLTSLTGCSSMVLSTKHDKDVVDRGVAYYLPKKLVTLNIQRKPTADLKKAQENLATAKKDTAGKKASVEAAKKLLEKTKENKRDAKQIEKAEADLQKAEDLHAIALDQQQKAQKALDEFLVGTKALVDVVKFEASNPMPDPDHLYTASLNHHWFASDSLNLKVTPVGLLSGANAEADDQTSEFVVALANTITSLSIKPLDSPDSTLFALTQGAPQPEKQVNETNCPKPSAEPNLNIAITFDPSVDEELLELNKKLVNKCYFAKVTKFEDVTSTAEALKRSSDLESQTHADHSGNELVTDREITKGLLYRMPKPYVIDIHRLEKICNAVPASSDACAKAELLSPVSSKVFILPNNGPIRVADMSRGLFVTTKYDVTFKDGMLVAYDASRPSEALGLISIPLDIVRGVFATIAQLVQLKIDVTTKQTESANAEVALLQALEALQEAQSDGDQENQEESTDGADQSEVTGD